MDEGEKKKKEGKSSSERQAAKKPAYKPTLVYRSVGGQQMGQQQQGLGSLQHTQSKGKQRLTAVQGSRMLTGWGEYRGISTKMCLGSE